MSESQIDREVIEAMVADAVEEAQRRIDAQPPKYFVVYGDEEEGLAPSPEQMEEARELAGPRDVIFAVAYTASDSAAAAAVADADDMLSTE